MMQPIQMPRPAARPVAAPGFSMVISLAHEAGIDRDMARVLVAVGQAIRNLDGAPLREVASTRTLILAGGLIAEGLSPRQAVQAAVVQILSDDPDMVVALGELIDAFLL